jgi:mRNA-degrading endonuclease toxin of MazEF toxin-antitoxin module
MNAWEVWQCPFPWGAHPAVIVSNSVRVERKPQIVVLSCQTMLPDACQEPQGNESLLDEADGMDWKTLCRCDLLYTIDKSILKFRRGTVQPERRRDIARKIIQGLAIAGL